MILFVPEYQRTESIKQIKDLLTRIIYLCLFFSFQIVSKHYNTSKEIQAINYKIKIYKFHSVTIKIMKKRG